MDLSLEGKRALVCGSTQGIGRACAASLADLGATITLCARHTEALQQTRDALPGQHGQTHDFIQADFSEPDDVSAKAASHIAQSGPVHILINNSGGPAAGPAFEGTAADYLDAFNRHLICSQLLVQIVAEGMRQAQYGRIINIISTSVITPIKGLGVSNTIRGAVANWGRTLAAELGPFGITVNNLLPGFTRTARLMSLFQGRANRSGTSLEEVEHGAIATIPARRLAEPEELASVVAFLASPAASYVNGVNLPVDGGRVAAQ